MGCDIHLAVEVRKGGKWERRNPLAEDRDPYLVENAAKEQEKPEAERWDYYEGRAPVTWYDERNYDTFAMLADVRNGYGFAGVDTGAGFNPIAEPRGLPVDVSPQVQNLYDGDETSPHYNEGDIWLGDHSHSWLTLDELDAYDWNQTTKHRGSCTFEAFKAMRAAGKAAPDAYCGSAHGPNLKTISMDEADAMLRDGKPVPDGMTYYVRCEWVERYSDSAGDFYRRVLPALRRLAEREGVAAGDVRIVFGFDS